MITYRKRSLSNAIFFSEAAKVFTVITGGNRSAYYRILFLCFNTDFAWKCLNSQFRYRLDFDLSKENAIYRHSLKEHFKIGKIAKFSGEMS